MSLNDTPSGERLHIGFFGSRNAGKSSLVNALTSQQMSVSLADNFATERRTLLTRIANIAILVLTILLKAKEGRRKGEASCNYRRTFCGAARRRTSSARAALARVVEG